MTAPVTTGEPSPVRPQVWVRNPAGEPRAAAHELLRGVAGQRLGIEPGEVELGYEPLGRPRLLGVRGLHVSLSHGSGLVAVALSGDGPVGVDVERIRPVPSLDLARRWLSAADADWLAGRHPGHCVDAFFWLWTQKEAIGKAIGVGLRDGGMRQQLPLPDRWPVRELVPAAVPGQPGLVVAAGRLPGDGMLGDGMLAVAFHGPPGGPPVRLTQGPVRLS